MTEYKVTTYFKGSTTGSNVIEFNVDMPVDKALMGDDLLNVAIKEKWVEEVTPRVTNVQAYINSQSEPVKAPKAPPKRGKK